MTDAQKTLALHELKREIRMRRAFYPDWVGSGKITEQQAAERMERLEWALSLASGACSDGAPDTSPDVSF